MEDEDDEFWTEERRKRLREKLEPELEQIRHITFASARSVERFMSWRSRLRGRNANRPD